MALTTAENDGYSERVELPMAAIDGQLDNAKMSWKRNFVTLIDRFAVPISAAIVSWIASTAWLIPSLPAEFVESTPLHLLIQSSVGVVAYVVARRLL